mmetsp:Transcript_16341/g.44353  ORF Transcript_16341/g.44353 Transcript_16341/m.44353 type:complete len:285 (+) Transcript_16341:113-967(+)
MYTRQRPSALQSSTSDQDAHKPHVPVLSEFSLRKAGARLRGAAAPSPSPASAHIRVDRPSAAAPQHPPPASPGSLGLQVDDDGEVVRGHRRRRDAPAPVPLVQRRRRPRLEPPLQDEVHQGALAARAEGRALDRAGDREPQPVPQVQPLEPFRGGPGRLGARGLRLGAHPGGDGRRGRDGSDPVGVTLPIASLHPLRERKPPRVADRPVLVARRHRRRQVRSGLALGGVLVAGHRELNRVSIRRPPRRRLQRRPDQQLVEQLRVQLPAFEHAVGGARRVLRARG